MSEDYGLVLLPLTIFIVIAIYSFVSPEETKDNTTNTTDFNYINYIDMPIYPTLNAGNCTEEWCVNVTFRSNGHMSWKVSTRKEVPQ